MTERYLTIKGEFEIKYEIEKSIFISRIARVESEEDGAAFINKIKGIEKDATHNCSAYIIGENGKTQKNDDDGEPSGIAGRPILQVIKMSGLTDCVIVVSRYYGGIKLGAGGLIRAYALAARDVIDAAEIVERIPYTLFRFDIDYTILKTVEYIFERSGFIITERYYSERVIIEAAVRDGDEDRFREIIANITSGSTRPEEIKRQYIDFPVKIK